MAAQSILIVEDDVDLRHLFRTALHVEGFEVLQAGDGLNALRILDAIPPPSLIVLDLGLPLVSGRVVRDELLAQAHLRDIPVVIVTGEPGPHADLRAKGVLHKPVPPELLVRTVRTCLVSGATSGA